MSCLQEYPPAKATYAKVFFALVAALKRSGELTNKAADTGYGSGWRRFVVDVLAVRLHGQDLSDVWDVRDPMGELAKILERSGRGEPESRLLWESGKDSLLGCCHVGVYSDKELIGQCKRLLVD